MSFMLKINPITKEQGSCFPVGRAATGIYLILEKEKKTSERTEVIVPANICYAAVLPVIYAGLTPIFCDVERLTGNVSLETLKDVVTDKTLAAIIPHMYGNPVIDMPKIKDFFSATKIVLIEDCASLMAISGKRYIPGTQGDYVVYSTGYSKTIDIGFGGLVFSENENLISLEREEHRLRIDNGESEKFWEKFSRQYRKYRNADLFSKEAQNYFNSIIKEGEKNLIFTISEEKKDTIIKSLEILPEIITKRREQNDRYKKALNKIQECIYPMSEDAVPWRFCLLIKDRRKKFIEYCLDNSLPVSDWYPRVTPVFNEKAEFPGAKWHEEHIVNFPLMIDDEKVDKICEFICMWS